MHQTIARNKCAIIHDYMAPQQRTASHYNVISDHNVVSRVTVLHQKIVRADDSLLGDLAGAMHSYVLAKDIVIPDSQAGWFVAIFQILRCFTNDTAGKESVSRADGCASRYINMRA